MIPDSGYAREEKDEAEVSSAPLCCMEDKTGVFFRAYWNYQACLNEERAAFLQCWQVIERIDGYLDDTADLKAALLETIAGRARAETGLTEAADAALCLFMPEETNPEDEALAAQMMQMLGFPETE